MKLRAATSLLVLASALPRAGAQNPEAVQFEAGNADGFWAVNAQVAGRMENRDGALHIALSRCVVTRPARFQTPTVLAGISAVITRAHTPDWSTQQRSGLHPIGQSLKPGGEFSVEPFELAIPLAGFELHGGIRWPSSSE